LLTVLPLDLATAAADPDNPDGVVFKPTNVSTWIGQTVVVNVPTSERVVTGRLVNIGSAAQTQTNRNAPPPITLAIGDNGEEYIQLQKYDGLRVLDANRAVHQPPTFISVHLTRPVRALHVHFQLMERTLSWTPHYEWFVDASLSRVLLLRGMATIKNHTSYDFRSATTRVTLQAFADPSRSQTKWAYQEMAASAPSFLARQSSVPLSSSSSASNEATPDVVATFRVDLAAPWLRAKAEQVATLFGWKQVPLRNLYAVDLSSDDTSGGELDAKPTQWLARVVNASPFEWPSGSVVVRVMGSAQNMTVISRAAHLPLTPRTATATLKLGASTHVTHTSRVTRIVQHDQDAKTGQTTESQAISIESLLIQHGQGDNNASRRVKIRVRIPSSLSVDAATPLKPTVVFLGDSRPSSLSQAMNLVTLTARAEPLTVVRQPYGLSISLDMQPGQLSALVRFNFALLMRSAHVLPVRF